MQSIKKYSRTIMLFICLLGATPTLHAKSSAYACALTAVLSYGYAIKMFAQPGLGLGRMLKCCALGTIGTGFLWGSIILPD
jgi:hypothetical protein